MKIKRKQAEILLFFCQFFFFPVFCLLASPSEIEFAPILNTNGNVFLKGERILLVVELHDYKTQDKQYVIGYKIFDFWNRVVQKGDAQVLIADDGKFRGSIPVEAEQPGWYKVELTGYINGLKINYRNGKTAQRNNDFTFAIIEPMNSDILNSQSPFGVCEHYLNEQNASLLQLAGIKWLRFDVYWDDIQRDPVHYNWKRLDDFFSISLRYNIHLLPIIDYGIPWGSTAPISVLGFERTRYAPVAQYYSKFLISLIKRYGESTNYWEVWNEPNIGFWKSPKNDYATFLIDSSNQIKSVNPANKVLMGGVGIIANDWVQMLYDEGATASFDIYNLHPYFYPEIPEKKLNAVLDGFNAFMLKIAMKETWITEMGIPTSVIDIHAQANQLVRSMIIALSKGIKRVFWYELADHKLSVTDKEANFGILNYDFSPKPAYVSYSVLIRLLDGAEFEKKISFNSATAVGYAFKRGNSRILVLWTVKTNETISFPFDNLSKAVMFDLMGVKRDWTGQNIELTDSPLFLVIN